jgi:CRISPR/Cas system-associated endoribonuclease Cas2
LIRLLFNNWQLGLIKDKNEIGFFIQESDFRSHSNPQEKEKLKCEIDQIVNKYPNSVIANQAKQSLERFRAVEEKIKANLKKMKKP